MLEEWLVRKEEELKSRVVSPPKSLRKTDYDLNEKIEGALRNARESMVSKLLEFDEFGKKAPAKSYKDLTTGELSRIAESLVVRLNLFNGDYPRFVPQAVRAILEHPNVSRADYNKVKTFSKMFNLDWRGDQSVSNRKEFLSTNPVYLNADDTTNFARYNNMDQF